MTTALAEFRAANSRYIVDDSTLAALDSLTEADWPAAIAATEELGGSDPGIDSKLVVTHETLTDFDAARTDHWRERGTRREADCAGSRAVIYDGVQLRKGEPRRTFAVLELGARRLVLE